MKKLLGVIAGALLLGAGCAHNSESRTPTGGSGRAGTGGDLSCAAVGTRDSGKADSQTARNDSSKPADTVSSPSPQLGSSQDTGIGGSSSQAGTSEDTGIGGSASQNTAPDQSGIGGSASQSGASEDTSVGSSASKPDTFEDTGMGGAGGGGG